MTLSRPTNVPPVALAALLIAVLVSDGRAEMTRPGAWGIGVSGGIQLPIAQEDAAAGPAFGVRARWGLMRFLELEPSAVLLANRDVSTASGLRLPAADVVSVGLNALVRTTRVGLGAYATLGLGWSRRNLPAAVGAASSFTANAGVGAEKQVGPVRIDVSPRFYLLRASAGATRKHLVVQVGATKYF